MATKGLTCLSCELQFVSPKEQQTHYATDWHAHNLKRKSVGLPPIKREVYEAAQAAKAAAANDADSDGSTSFNCLPCKKRFASQNALDTHKNSKKHKEAMAASRSSSQRGVAEAGTPTSSSSGSPSAEDAQREPSSANNGALAHSKDDGLATTPTTTSSASSGNGSVTRVAARAAARQREAALAANLGESRYLEGLLAMADLSPEEREELLKVKESATRLTERQCLFCESAAASFEANVSHMARAHGFVLPDAEYLADPKGLVQYLADKIAVGHVCLVCDGVGRTFHTLEAVRCHMVDTGHCRVKHEELGEYEEFFDYSPLRQQQENRLVLQGQVTMNEFGELRLPSGRMAGHRDLVRLYKQYRAPQDVRDSVYAATNAYVRRLGWRSPAALAREQDTRNQFRIINDGYQKLKLHTGFRNNHAEHFRRSYTMW